MSSDNSKNKIETPDIYIYQRGDRDFHIQQMSKSIGQKQELDTVLEKIIRPSIVGQTKKILDAGCGLGQVITLLHAMSPNSQYWGVDQTPEFIKYGAQLHAHTDNVQLTCGNIEDLPSVYEDKFFDLTVCRAVISWTPAYAAIIQSLIQVTRERIYLCALFYDGDIDFIIQIREYTKEAGKKDFSEYRNIYSLPEFKRFLISLGLTKIEVVDFEMPIDIPRGPINIMGTYTELLANGKRLQISGVILMQWKWIIINL